MIDYKKLSDDRRAALNEIFFLIKREFPDHVAVSSCVRAPTIEILTAIFGQVKQIEKGRNTFRDELIRHGYTHDDLVKLVENADESKTSRKN